ncbi:MAG: 3-oxoacyl-ACP synthase [Actinophytocola sp.]|uniref:ketoacyl-ACP synthase III family protein n=1 Tax=Actinophytocola sp. TaxID=1872138 RepID=UPI0013265909|nr:ketoacyl-ACP synthase III family protein [Actinophytocola sp.]MPZ81286.1 3-oxoacyl-ACP synthase [Actinophytocola sp.]
MKTPGIFIKGTGVYLPDKVTSEWAVEQGLYSAEEIELHGLTSTSVAGDTPAPEMALRAAERALKRCRQDGTDLSLLLYASTWHQGPEGWLAHSYLQHHLVGGDVPATEIRQGCNGMFTSLELAVCHLRAEPQRQAALLVAADNYGTPMVNRWRMGGGYIGGDAGSAVVLAKDSGFARLLSVASTTVDEAEEMHRGDEPLFPPGITVGRGLDFTTRNQEFQRHARRRTAGTAPLFKVHQRTISIVETVLAEADLEIADIARVAFMNYSREIVEQRCMAALGLPMSRSTWDIGATIGHCGASDQFIALDHLIGTGGLRPGDHMLMLGVSPGVTLAAAVVQIVDVPPWVS